MRTLLIHTHNGTGDAIICNGMVRYLYEKMKNKFHQIYLLVDKFNEKSVMFLYQDFLKDKLRLLLFDAD